MNPDRASILDALPRLLAAQRITGDLAPIADFILAREEAAQEAGWDEAVDYCLCMENQS